MGRGMAVNLAKAGHSLRLYTRNLSKIQDLKKITCKFLILP
ncbi:phosphogluconate dehydrogenase (decarboxylating), NAD binding domain protein [Leptospira interrogans str. 2002000626]|uniref:Phosphogluconate dehydrogenase (Decarboxylating), NAD binding domain protein n=2 Tax=Leptospira interrogans TaxID=173 RepID=A0A829D773_LEPIR|nr:phosphogluconate dehydrogenase (decarboxylating), NAD binding domain protein [Leptospira interrogans str. 2002000626]EMY23794.1 phosphogluconate dehydrogenase (decarboxylating), NAD binding domain protein [Leptospira interrogans serovar Australis str. 200703203]